jgi:hypothetical protein
MTPMRTVAPRLQSPSPGAKRMQRLRDRRRQGRIFFGFELEPWAVSGLVELGWLAGSRRDDHAAIVHAFHRFVGYALDMTRNRRQ